MQRARCEDSARLGRWEPSKADELAGKSFGTIYYAIPVFMTAGVLAR